MDKSVVSQAESPLSATANSEIPKLTSEAQMTGMVKDLVFYLLKIMLVTKFVTCAFLVDNTDQH